MPEQGGHDDDNDDFTFPTPPQLLLLAAYGHHHHSSRRRVSPVVLTPIRRSFSAADSAASMWGSSPRAACSPTFSDYAAGYSDLEEEVMDSLWQDLNDDCDEKEAPVAERKKDAGDDLDVSHRRSFWFPSEPVERRAATTKDQCEGAPAVQLPASRSSRRQLAGMMRALKKMLVTHKSRSKVHKVDEQGAAVSRLCCLRWIRSDKSSGPMC